MATTTLIRRACGCAFALLLALPLSLQAQGAPSDDVLDEIRSLGVRVQVAGGTASLEGALRTVLTQELERVGILRNLPAHRAGDCCELLLDVRVVEGSASVPDWGGIAAYSARLELGQSERLGRLDTRMVLWTGRTRGDVVIPTDLAEQLRFAARELTVEFVDRYLQRFPIR